MPSLTKDIVCASCGKVQTWEKPAKVAGRPPVRCANCHKPTNKPKGGDGFGSWTPVGAPV